MRSFHKTKLIRLLGVGAAMAAFFIAPKAADACNQYKVGFQVTVPPDNNRNFPIFYTAQSTCPNNPQPVCAPSTGITLPVNTTTTQKCTAIVADIQSRCTHLTVAADCQNTQSFTIVDANCPAGGFGHGGLFFGVSNSNEVLEPNVSAILPDYEFDTIAPDCANLLGAVSVLKGGATGVTIVMGDTSWVEAFLTLPTSTVVSFRRPTSNGDIARNVLGDLATGLNNQLGGTGINCFVDPTFHASLECSAPAGGGAITLSLHVNDTGFARLNLATPDTQTFNTLVSQAGNPDAGPLSSTTLVAPVNPVPATGSVALLGLAGLLGATGAWFVRRRRFKLEILQ